MGTLAARPGFALNVGISIRHEYVQPGVVFSVYAGQTYLLAVAP
ncbi:hypothetical protein [Alicyclobacillus herbarius]|nr:hypothetical protein [Alicyclobacillus herbarius]